MSMTTKLDRVGIFNEELPFITSHNPLIRWSCKVTWNIKSITSLLQQCQWPPKVARWWLTMRSFHSQSYRILWTCSHMRPLDKLKKLSPLPQCLCPQNQAWANFILMWTFFVFVRAREVFETVKLLSASLWPTLD